MYSISNGIIEQFFGTYFYPIIYSFTRIINLLNNCVIMKIGTYSFTLMQGLLAFLIFGAVIRIITLRG